MDAQDFHSLSEAYMNVYQEQELNEGLTPAQIEKIAKKAAGKPTTKSAKKIPAGMKEEVDLYDIILSHLLDEGYAETPEAAEAIMVNMSEEWRDDIIDEELTGDRLSRAARKDGRDALAKKDRTILHRVMGHSNQDQTSFGKGNKATRRQGYTVPDTSNRPYQDEWRSSHNKNRGVKNKKSGNYN